jgi:uncharacterized LabA/DUF88 family protein
MRISKLVFILLPALILLACVPALAQDSSAFNPIKAQTAYVFIDGSNLFNKLREANIQLLNLYAIIKQVVSPRELVRAYLYTIEDKLQKALALHGPDFCKDIRVVHGISIQTPKGVREKAVDAMLVADLVYHAAQKNCDFALVVAHDQDYVRALQRVEDFGCRTGVLALCEPAPQLLQEACDKYIFRDIQSLIQSNMAKKLQGPSAPVT